MNPKVIAADTPALITLNMWGITPTILALYRLFHRPMNKGVAEQPGPLPPAITGCPSLYMSIPQS